MTRKHTWLLALVPGLWLSACAETSFQDTLGIGKSAPDETKVQTVQPLAVPPDLALRPPSGAASRTAAANADGDSGVENSRTLAVPPARDASPAQATPTPVATRTAAASSATPKEAKADKPSGDFYDIYRKHGISIYDENGKRKSIAQLNMELGRKLKEERRRKNPRYGTIFNIESIWKD